MNYVFQFGIVWPEVDKLLLGTWFTLRLSALAMVLGLVVGVAGRARQGLARRARLRALVHGYVEAMRNTPFLVQLLLLYLGLPSLGLRLTPDQAALLAMVVNLGAYATEIVRAGIEAVPSGQIEAGRALGLRPHADLPLRRPGAGAARRVPRARAASSSWSCSPPASSR